MKVVAPLLIACAWVTSLEAEVTLAPPFTDGAVLQREKTVPVWGTADAGEKISVSFAGQTLTTTANADGRWRVDLAALPASAEARELVVKGTNTLTLRNVVVGEVWIASGQSNMEWPLSHTANAKTVIAAANYPLVREFKVARNASFTPLETAEGTWASALPETVGKFSGAGYYFALDLHQKLKVPVGILNCSWGGTGISPWIAPEGYKTTPALAAQFAKQEKGPRATPEQKAAYEAQKAAWEKEKADAKVAGKPFSTPEPKAPPGLPGTRTLAGLYNAMVHPVVPYALRGAIWYQGESNVSQASSYAAQLNALVTGWRSVFAQGEFPFYWVQLPNFDFGNRNADNWQWANLREAQTKALSTPNTAQAITIDVGEAKGLHPKDKESVGQRLALLALARTYGVKGVVDSGPVFAAAKREGAAYRITYQPSSSTLKGAPAGLTGFELAGEDKVFHDAEARIDGATVIVTSPAVKNPTAVRYAFRNAPVAGLFNAEGMPAAPFRTDTW
jgi:sialate O-acetylesterase